MNKLTILFQQVLMISTGTLFMTGINGVVSHFTGKEFTFEWYYPFSIILLGIFCSFPTALLILSDNIIKKKSYALNLALHFLSILVVLHAVGYIFKWYSTAKEVLFLSLYCVVVYAFVWAATLWLLREEDKKINQALKNIQDEE